MAATMIGAKLPPPALPSGPKPPPTIPRRRKSKQPLASAPQVNGEVASCTEVESAVTEGADFGRSRTDTVAMLAMVPKRPPPKPKQVESNGETASTAGTPPSAASALVGNSGLAPPAPAFPRSTSLSLPPSSPLLKHSPASAPAAPRRLPPVRTRVPSKPFRQVPPKPIAGSHSLPTSMSPTYGDSASVVHRSESVPTPHVQQKQPNRTIPPPRRPPGRPRNRTSRASVTRKVSGSTLGPDSLSGAPAKPRINRASFSAPLKHDESASISTLTPPVARRLPSSAPASPVLAPVPPAPKRTTLPVRFPSSSLHSRSPVLSASAPSSPVLAAANSAPSPPSGPRRSGVPPWQRRRPPQPRASGGSVTMPRMPAKRASLPAAGAAATGRQFGGAPSPAPSRGLPPPSTAPARNVPSPKMVPLTSFLERGSSQSSDSMSSEDAYVPRGGDSPLSRPSTQHERETRRTSPPHSPMQLQINAPTSPVASIAISSLPLQRSARSPGSSFDNKRASVPSLPSRTVTMPIAGLLSPPTSPPARRKQVSTEVGISRTLTRLNSGGEDAMKPLSLEDCKASKSGARSHRRTASAMSTRSSKKGPIILDEPELVCSSEKRSRSKKSSKRRKHTRSVSPTFKKPLPPLPTTLARMDTATMLAMVPTRPPPRVSDFQKPSSKTLPRRKPTRAVPPAPAPSSAPSSPRAADGGKGASSFSFNNDDALPVPSPQPSTMSAPTKTTDASLASASLTDSSPLAPTIALVLRKSVSTDTGGSRKKSNAKGGVSRSSKKKTRKRSDSLCGGAGASSIWDSLG